VTGAQAAGGLGLFLLGMIVMTDGLKALAGDTVRGVLMRFTRSPVSGAMTGAVGTALLQSSSATTVAAVGFVGARLISFPSALGIVFGANLGTTFKGWVIALLGFKYELDSVFMPLILVGAILRLFGGRRSAAIGYAVAGFGLVFVGITMMQDAMSGLEGIITPESLPPDTLFGRLAIVAIGILATVVTQSSSAGVAATITALHAQAITFEQGAALVIGMDVGTTITAALATMGGSVDVKRTGYSHVVYNLLTAAGAWLLITPFVAFWEWFSPGFIQSEGEIAIVAFHMTFNGIGVIAILPFTSKFAQLMIRLVPERPGALTMRLDRSLLEHSTLALDAVQETLAQTYVILLSRIRTLLTPPTSETADNVPELEAALENTSAFLDQIHLRTGKDPDWERLVALMQSLDHTQRLLDRCDDDDLDRVATARDTPELRGACEALLDGVAATARAIDTQEWVGARRKTKAAEAAISAIVTPFRDTTMADMARGDVTGRRGAEMMRALRWLRRVSKHVASVTFYLERAYQAAGKETAR